MKKFRLLFLTIFVIVAGILLFETESNATNLDTVKKNVDFANSNKEYNIKDYGNDEKAINTAIKIASAQGIKEGKQAIVYIPNGTYTIKDRISVFSNVYILCENSVVINREKGSDYIIFQMKENETNITIDGGTFNGNSGKNNIIHIKNNKNVTIKNTVLK